MDDRFENGNPYQYPQSKNWDGKTLEEVVKEAIQRGQEKEIAMLIKLLPEENRERYRQIYAEMKGKK